MTWQKQLKGDSLTWLLEADSPGVRYLALRDLVDDVKPAELRTARQRAHAKGPIEAILRKMKPPGYWAEVGPGYNPKYRSTVWSIILLAQLGASAKEDERIRIACAYLLDQALTESGQFSASGAPSGTADCLQGNLCWAVRELQYEDPRLDGAIEWMARTVTGEGISPVSARTAPRRYFAGKCGPTFACGSNNKLPCAWGAVKVVLALGQLPERQRTPLIKRAIAHALEFFFSVEPAEAAYPSGYAPKPSGNWWKFGFPVFYVTDLLQLVEALIAVGGATDRRLARALAVIRERQDPDGRWSLDYDYTGKTWVDFGHKGRPNKWVTLRALRVLKAAG